MQRSVFGEAAEWGPIEHLLASVVDVLQAANWQRSGPKAKRPKPLPRPGQKEPGHETYRPKSRSIEDMRSVLADWHAGKFESKYRPKDVKVVR